MAVLARYGFVDKYREYIMFWLSYMCDFSSLSLVRNDRIGHFNGVTFLGQLAFVLIFGLQSLLSHPLLAKGPT